MRYAIEATVNYKDTEEDRSSKIVKDVLLAGIEVTDIIESYPNATSFVLTIVPTV